MEREKQKIQALRGLWSQCGYKPAYANGNLPRGFSVERGEACGLDGNPHDSGAGRRIVIQDEQDPVLAPMGAEKPLPLI